jgi:chaperonin GroES
MFPIRPYKDRLIVEPHKLDDKTKGGLFIPEIAKGKAKKGTVIRAGKECESEFNVGDVVLWPEGAGTEFELDEKMYLLLRANDIQMFDETENVPG